MTESPDKTQAAAQIQRIEPVFLEPMCIAGTFTLGDSLLTHLTINGIVFVFSKERFTEIRRMMETVLVMLDTNGTKQ